MKADINGIAYEINETLCHELSHAFLNETQIEIKETFSEENLCEFIGMYSKKICEIADKYFKEE